MSIEICYQSSYYQQNDLPRTACHRHLSRAALSDGASHLMTVFVVCVQGLGFRVWALQGLVCAGPVFEPI